MRFLLLIVLVFNINLSFALNEGRDYSMSDSGGSSFFSVFLIILGLIVFIVLVLRSFLSSSQNMNNREQRQSRMSNRNHGSSNTDVYENYNSGLCHKCKGSGYSRRKLNYKEYYIHMNCTHCNGYGKTISGYIKSQIEEVKEKYKDIDLDIKLSLYFSGLDMEANEIKKILLPLPNCPHCNGTGKSPLVSEHMGEYYLLEKCEICNGTGYN